MVALLFCFQHICNLRLFTERQKNGILVKYRGTEFLADSMLILILVHFRAVL
jgi:hypothetical protein